MLARMIPRTWRPFATVLAFRGLAGLGLVAACTVAAATVDSLPSLPRAADGPPADWLVRPVARKAGVFRGAAPAELVLDNGLVRRTFRLAPNAATVGLDNLQTGAALLRAVKPEALLTLDGTEFAMGGLVGQRNQAYLLPEWLDTLQAGTNTFRLRHWNIGPTVAPFAWQRRRHAEPRPWPPPGAALHLSFAPPDARLEGLDVTVHYELYDGLPAMAKWLTVSNGTARTVRVDRFTSELLALAEVESIVDDFDPQAWRKPWVTLLSDYTFGGMALSAGNKTTAWVPDPSYTAQVNYNLKTPALLVSRPPIGPAIDLAPGAAWSTYRSLLMVHDTDQRERQGLALRRLYRALAPWCTESPIMMHVRNADTQAFRLAVDQCAAVGFEMIIYTFGSGLNMESDDPAYLARIKADVDYAHAKGIEVGAYSLLASRRINDDEDVINPATGKTGGAIFGNSPCLGSRWADDYFRRVTNFIARTGLDLLEHDGSYPGDLCASTQHPGHRGLEDSQWTQWRRITGLYEWCRERGVFLNVPDHYFFNGANKTGMGYREVNWSLPRAEQILTGRQNLFDGTWEKTPSMGWMFVPLTEYQGGGAAATIEPLSEHLDAYEAHLANNLGAGVQACWRGPRLYDTDATRELVARWVSWFKEYRDILESDLIHWRRADGRNLDGWLHVNPSLQRKGLAVIYNPRPEPVRETVRLPLYYTGLTETARVREGLGKSRRYRLDRHYEVAVPISVPAKGMTWLVVE